MSKRPKSLAALPVMAWWIVAASVASAAKPAALPVFPGAEGFGVATRAGRGGKVLRVATLDAAGAGSLRAALEAKGPRVVVFDVGGVIDLGKKRLAIRDPFVTGAGQTAPRPGIPIVGSGISVRTHDVLIRHLSVRPCDRGGKGSQPDAISIGDGKGAKVYNVVVDHCSLTWAVDENASVSGPAGTVHDVTYSNCIISEGLSHSTHPKGEHSKGTLVIDGCKRVAILRNLYAHNFRRNPYVKADTSTVVANNLIYNPGQLAIMISCFSGKRPVASIVANVLIAGPSSPPGLGLIGTMGRSPLVYRKGNVARDARGGARAILSGGKTRAVRKWRARVRVAKTPPIWPGTLTVLPAAEVVDRVLAGAGARPADRDPIDARIVQTVRRGTGKIIDSPKDVGGTPRRRATRRKLKLPADPNGDADGDGYTNLERWLHDLAAALERAPAARRKTR